ncbi:carbohydrate-binding module family 20 domain-containing protein [Streptomyces sp. MS06]|uniref:carbohydrate-binding module family 20 domain-containing protein n=1 Tax=Streptomyces sp. MS06 TaxID=3385974 RepID=UPI0039A3870D
MPQFGRTRSPRSGGRPRRTRTLLAAAGSLVAGTLLPLTLTSGTAHAGSPNGGDVIANLWEWNWPSVAAECTTVLGPKGYGAVQVAPPQDSIRLDRSSHPWWEVYQPVGYDLDSRMGTRQQFVDMVTACHNAGVKVYVDAVVNHTAGTNQTSTDSYGGASFDESALDYPSIGYTPADFHSYPADCPNADLAIDDWDNVRQVQECDLVGLADLRTESEHVRTTIAGYLNDLIGIGVDGFRIDAAKHIAQTDFAAVLDKLDDTLWGARPYISQEVIPTQNPDLSPGAFESNGSVIEFTYANQLKNQFTGSIANLRTFGDSSWNLEPSDLSTVMVTNHDTERNGQTLSYKNGDTYTLANIFELAWDYGTPQVYSAFTFDTNDDSPPASADGHVTDTVCGSAWTCTDRDQGIANMVAWHNAAMGRPVAHWYDDGSNLIAFSRGSRAWVAINNEAAARTHTFATGLPAGTYCDVIHGDYDAAAGTCSGPTVTVDGAGDATVSVAAEDAVALYGVVAGGPSPSPTPSSSPTPSPTPSPSSSPTAGRVAETFTVNGAPGSSPVYLAGSVPGLGGWSPSAAVPMTKSGSTWTVTVDLPQNTGIEYKYIQKDSSGSVTWEPGDNHGATTGSGGTASLTDVYNGSGSGSTTVSESFDEQASVRTGQHVYLVGSVPALGGWNTDDAVSMGGTAPNWTTTVTLPADTYFEYKYIKKDPDGTIEWESGANHSATTGTSGSGTLSNTWSSTSTAPVGVTFDENKATVPGQNVYVVGSTAGLGTWDTGQAVPLSSAAYPVWSATVSMAPNTYFEYKYIVKDGSGDVTWESGDNRSYATGSSGSVTLDDTWK